jgi:putative MATE family efflux protein
VSADADPAERERDAAAPEPGAAERDAAAPEPAEPGPAAPEPGPAAPLSLRALRWKILRFALPGSLEVVIHSLFGLVDQIFVASLGEASFVAAGLTAQVLTLAFSFLTALGTGASIRLARHAGARDHAAFSATAAQALQVTAVVAIAISLLAAIFAPVAFDLLGAAPDVAERGVFFTRLVGSSLPFMALMEVGNHALRTRGDVKTPVFIALAALALNSLFNYILIFGWWGLPRLGLAGAGIATLGARALGFALVMAALLARRHDLRVRAADLLRPQLAHGGSLLRLALPIAIGQALWLLGLMGYTRVYAALGTRDLAAASVIGQLEGLCVMFAFGFAIACMTLVGQELGRRDHAAARRVAVESWRMAVIASLVTATVLAATGGLVDRLYPELATETRALAALGLWISALLQPLKISNMVLAMGVLRSGGDVRFVTINEVWILVGVACAWLFGVHLGLGIAGVLIGKACEEALKLAAFSWRLKSGRWIHELR